MPDTADRAVVLAAEKERLIFHLLRMYETTVGVLRSEWVELASQCLEEFGYAPDGERAKAMLSLGEPGRYLSEQGGTSK